MEKAPLHRKLAFRHSAACQQLVEAGELNDALRYCVAHGIEPPFAACDKRDPDYANYLERAAACLCDYAWWEKRLKLNHARRAASILRPLATD